MNIFNKNLNVNTKKYTLISVSILLLFSNFASKEAFSATPYTDDNQGIEVLKVSSYKTPLDNKNEIYANGKMQSQVLIEYKLGPNFIKPQFLIKERYTHDLLPRNGWNVEYEFNKLPHFISNSGAKPRKGKKPPKRSNPARVFYISNNSGLIETIDVCVEVTATHKITKNEITRNTCDDKNQQNNAVTINTLIPLSYQNKDFSLTQKYNQEKDKFNKKLYLRYYELTANNNRKFTIANPKQINIRKPNSLGTVYSMPGVAALRVTKKDRLFYVEALRNETKSYQSPDVEKKVTEFKLNTKNPTSLKPIVKLAAMYGKEFSQTVWPSGLDNQLANSMTIRVLDEYGNPTDLTLTISGWALYFGDEFIW